MKTNNFLTIELSNEELINTTGGTITLAAIGAIAVSALFGATLLAPLAAAAYQGWTDESK